MFLRKASLLLNSQRPLDQLLKQSFHSQKINLFKNNISRITTFYPTLTTSRLQNYCVQQQQKQHSQQQQIKEEQYEEQENNKNEKAKQTAETSRKKPIKFKTKIPKERFGKIILIYNDEFKVQYIGFTIKEQISTYVKDQINFDRKKYKDGVYRNLAQATQQIGIEKMKWKVVQTIANPTKKQLMKLKQDYIKEYKDKRPEYNTLNEVVPLRLSNQYYQDNREKFLERYKEYQRNRSERMHLKDPELNILKCHCCGYQTLSPARFKTHLATKKHQKKIKEQENSQHPEFH